jgi:hypothetical protein
MKQKHIVFIIICIISQSAYSQILNGGFENWTTVGPIGWAAFYPSAKGTPHSGGFSLHYSALPIMSSDILWGKFKISPSFRILSFWYQANYSADSPLQLYFYTKHDSGLFTLPIAETWTKYTIHFSNASLNEDSISLRYSIVVPCAPFDYCGAMFCLLDDIRLDSVEESVAEKTSKQIEVFPNPIISHAILKCPEVFEFHASIFDLTGRKVLQLPSLESASGDGAIPFDVDNLPNGMYYLKIEAESNVQMQKIIVQH